MIRKFYDYGGLNIGGGESFSIADYNQRCAEFIGALYSESAKSWGFGNAKNIGSKMFHGIMYNNVIQAERFEKELKFHSDWNWIMEVVEAIEKLNYTVEIYSDTCLIQSNDGEYSETGNVMVRCSYDECSIKETKKEAVVQAINLFLIWYNENK